MQPGLMFAAMDSGLILAFLLIGAGFLLMVAELFIPSGGILSVLCIAALGVGVTFAFQHNSRTGWWTLLGVFIATPAFAMLLFRIWPHTPMGKKFFLKAPEGEASRLQMAAHDELAELVGKTGKTLSTLRPSGMVDFQDRRVDCISEGMMIGEGQWVRCVEARGGRVVVRPAEKPIAPDALEDLDFERMSDES